MGTERSWKKIIFASFWPRVIVFKKQNAVFFKYQYKEKRGILARGLTNFLDHLIFACIWVSIQVFPLLLPIVNPWFSFLYGSLLNFRQYHKNQTKFDGAMKNIALPQIDSGICCLNLCESNRTWSGIMCSFETSDIVVVWCLESSVMASEFLYYLLLIKYF